MLGFVAMVAGAWLVLSGRPGSQEDAGDVVARLGCTRWSGMGNGSGIGSINPINDAGVIRWPG